MANKQSKRRRKKYEPGSAYAGDVKPTGVLGFLSSGMLIKIVFIGMALALAIGGAATIFGGNVFRSSSNHSSFVEPDDQDGDDVEPTPAEFEVTQYGAPPVLSIDEDSTITAIINTELGEIEVELLPGLALETVNNFVFLAQDGFYDGLTFHHVATGFSATAGDPACSVEAPEGLCRGTGGPGYELDENVPGEVSVGMLGMANGSQFFIALTDSADFGEFGPFGTIKSGFDVAEQLVSNTPIDSIVIVVQ